MNTMLISESTRPTQPSSAVLKRTSVVPSTLVERNRRRADRQHGAVLGRTVIDVVDGEEAAGARHVLRHDVGAPGMCLPIWRASPRA